MRFTAASSLTEAYEHLAALGSEATVLAGGTDLMVQHQAGLIHPGHLLYVGGLGELRGVHVPAPGRVRIGALTSHRQLATDPASRQALPALATAASTVGGWQTQVAGTIGGNLANASPAADTPPALLIAGATVHLGSRHGTRSIPIDRFIRGRRDIDREPDELVVAVECDTLPGDAAEVYLKVAPRSAMEVAVVGLAVRLSVHDGVLASVAIAATAVGSRPFRAFDAEALLAGSAVTLERFGDRIDAERLTAAGTALAAASSPIDDVRSSAAYRRGVLPGLLRRALERCFDQLVTPPTDTERTSP